MSKFSLDVLNRCVYPHFQTQDPDVLLGAVFGEDVALTKVGGEILASHVDPIVGAVQNIGWLAVHVACNDIATCGAPPRWILPLILVPSKDDEALLTEIMRDISRAAEEIGITIIGGHTGYSANLTRPLVAVTALGTLAGRQPILTRGARIGDHVLVTKGIALEGTGILASDFTHAAKKLGLSDDDLEQAKTLMEDVSVIPEALILAEHGASSMHDVTRGGLLETLMEIALLSDTGIEIQFEKIPIHTIVHRFAKAFGYNPLKMISSGTLAATISPENLAMAKKELNQQGIVFADIGIVTDGKGVKIIHGEEIVHHKEIRPEEDELARMWNEYQLD